MCDSVTHLYLLPLLCLLSLTVVEVPPGLFLHQLQSLQLKSLQLHLTRQLRHSGVILNLKLTVAADETSHTTQDCPLSIC